MAGEEQLRAIPGEDAERGIVDFIIAIDALNNIGRLCKRRATVACFGSEGSE